MGRFFRRALAGVNAAFSLIALAFNLTRLHGMQQRKQQESGHGAAPHASPYRKPVGSGARPSRDTDSSAVRPSRQPRCPPHPITRQTRRRRMRKSHHALHRVPSCHPSFVAAITAAGYRELPLLRPPFGETSPSSSSPILYFVWSFSCSEANAKRAEPCSLPASASPIDHLLKANCPLLSKQIRTEG